MSSLSNLLSIINNGQKNRLVTVTCPSSQFTLSILQILQDNGFILGFRSSSLYSFTTVIFLKYTNHQPAISQCLLISKSSRRIFKSIKHLSWEKNSVAIFSHLFHKHSLSFDSLNKSTPVPFMNGLFILSTSKGILSHQHAQNLNVGGEILCHIS